MTVQKKQKKPVLEKRSHVEKFYKSNKDRMVFISGNFRRGGFSISQNKIAAILDNIEILRKFANGEYNEDIDILSDDEVFIPDQ